MPLIDVLVTFITASSNSWIILYLQFCKPSPPPQTPPRNPSCMFLRGNRSARSKTHIDTRSTRDVFAVRGQCCTTKPPAVNQSFDLIRTSVKKCVAMQHQILFYFYLINDLCSYFIELGLRDYEIRLDCQSNNKTTKAVGPRARLWTRLVQPSK